MLIKGFESEPVKKMFLSDYRVSEVVALFKDKYNCFDCPFRMLYKGKVNRSGDLFRSYCGLKYITKAGINLILFTGYTEKELDFLFTRYEKNDLSAPDLLKLHPKNPVLLMVSIIRVKELDNCPIDRHNRGEEQLNPLLKKRLDHWLEKYKNADRARGKSLSHSELTKALKRKLS